MNQKSSPIHNTRITGRLEMGVERSDAARGARAATGALALGLVSAGDGVTVAVSYGWHAPKRPCGSTAL